MAVRRPRPDPPEFAVGLDPAWAEEENPASAAPAPAENAPLAPVPLSVGQRIAPRQTARPAPRSRPQTGRAVLAAVPHAGVVLFAFLPLLLPLPRASGLALATFLLVLAQIAGFVVASEMGLVAWRRIWLINLMACAVVWPVLALHTSLVRTPYVSAELGSLGPVAVTALIAGLVMLAVAVVVAVATADEPARASLLFAPVAVLVPVMLGTDQDLSQGVGLAALGEAFLVAGAVAFVAELVPGGLRPFAAPAGLAVQLVVLWVLGYRPERHVATENLAPLLSSLLLGWTILLAVVVPLMAVAVRRVLVAAGDEEWA